MRKSLLALLLLAATGLVQAQVQLRDGHPQSYTVVAGDTLWDISGKFLNQPWKWPELWRANPQVHDPDLIYPGDTLSCESEVIEKRRSKSKPEMGLLKTKLSAFNQHGEVVMTYIANGLISTRDPGGTD